MLIGACVLLSGGYAKGRRQPESARLTVQMRHLFAGQPLRLNALTLRNRAGNMLSVSRLAYLISGVSLLRADGSAASLGGQFAYLNPGENRNSFTLRNAPAGRYVGLRFSIGLPPEINHADPESHAAGHALHPLVNRLHWGWQGGYVFLALEGKYVLPSGRTSGYVYHLATDANLMTVTLSREFELTGESRLELDFDVEKVFSAVAPIAIGPQAGEDSTHSAQGDTLAARLKTNVERAIAFEA